MARDSWPLLHHQHLTSHSHVLRWIEGKTISEALKPRWQVCSSSRQFKALDFKITFVTCKNLIIYLDDCGLVFLKFLQEQTLDKATTNQVNKLIWQLRTIVKIYCARKLKLCDIPPQVTLRHLLPIPFYFSRSEKKLYRAILHGITQNFSSEKFTVKSILIPPYTWGKLLFQF